MELNVKCKTTKLLEDNAEGNLDKFKYSNKFSIE